MGGSPADVFGFGLGLDMGDIAGADAAGEAFWAGRRQVLERLYSVYPEGPAAAVELCRRARETLQTVLDRAAAGEDLRLWTSGEPGERCGAAWLLAVLQNRLSAYRGRMWLAELPRTELRAALAEMDTEFSGAVLIGTVLGQYRPGVGDAWLALRVQAMVEAGELVPVTAAPAEGARLLAHTAQGGAVKDRAAGNGFSCFALLTNGP